MSELKNMVVGGVKFVPLDPAALTFRRKMYLFNRVSKLGLQDVFLPNADPEAATYAILLKMMQSEDVVIELIAGFYTPNGATWSPERAQATATALGAARPEDHEQLELAMAGVLGSFFENGVLWSGISQSVSPNAPRTTSEAPPSTSAPTSSASGTPSSESSADTTLATTSAS